MKKSSATLRGIVVAGDSREEAENHYRAVATGLSVQALQDEEQSFVILSNADSELSLMNPLTGDMSLVEASDLNTDSFEFLASGEDEKVKVFYTLCSDGCGSHIIADDSELMVRCPVCASQLQDLDAEDIAEYENDIAESSDDSELDYDEEDDADDTVESSSAMIVAADSKEAAVEAFRKLAEGEDSPSVYNCESSLVATASDSDFQFSPFTGEAAEEEDSVESFEVEASSEEGYDAHYYVCASEECGSHVIASNEDPVFCPVCASGLIEPENLFDAQASDDDEEDDDEEDDDDLLDGLDDEDDGLDDDDEATASDDDDPCWEGYEQRGMKMKNGKQVPNCVESGGDEEDEDEDEDLDDDEDLDELEEDEDDEDEDFDDKNSMSVSSVRIFDEGELESVSTDLLSLASASSGGLEDSYLSVAFAGELAGTPTWLALYNGQIVATSTPETAKGVEHNVFNSDVYANLVHASAKENGVKEALDELGFKPIQASVDVDSYIQEEVASRVEAGVSSVRDNFEQSSSDYAARFEAALATAATGVNKNFFDDVKNPVKSALASAMNSVGVRNADRLVAQAFAKHNDEYLKGLVAKACEIMEYDVSVQNQLTKAVASTSHEQSVTASSDSSDLAIGRPVHSEQPSDQSQNVRQEAVASADSKPKVNLDTVLSTLGRRGRN